MWAGGPKDLTLTCVRGFVCPLLLLCLRSCARGDLPVQVLRSLAESCFGEESGDQ
jgi:hypothetical protein